MAGRKGFTLIELLVVVAIIALLMAILMPALGRVRRDARAVVCQARIKQWGYIFTMYTDDNDGYFEAGDKGDGGMRGRWMYVHEPIYKDGKMRLCPMAAKLDNKWGGTGRQPYAAWGPLWGPESQINPISQNWPEPPFEYTDEDNMLSYGQSDWILNTPEVTKYVTIKGKSYNRPTLNWRTPAVNNSGRIPVFMDCSYWCADPYDTDSPPAYEQDVETAFNINEMKRFCVNRHNAAINCLMMDFSVRKVGLKSLWKLKWHRAYNVNADPPNWGDEAPWMLKLRDL